MLIYKHELDIQDKLQNNVISFASAVQPITLESKVRDKVVALLKSTYKSRATIHDEDLYFHKSILVSSNWNKNDDVFDKLEAWIARYTPIHKPTNIEHDESKIVGHMVDSFAIDNNGNIINDDILPDDLPDLFHICNSSVVYRMPNTAYEARASELIQAIEDGKVFVSMECLFTNFDYAVITPTKEYRVIARSSETAFLTKHLRAYGGDGYYQGHRIGRLLRNIVFSGKGYVDKPANENSIILNEETVFDFGLASANNSFIFKNGVLISCKSNLQHTENSMNEEQLKAKIEELTQANTALTAELASAKENSQSLTSKVEELTSALAAANTAKDTAEASTTELKAQLDSVVTEKTAIATELATIKTEKLKTDRVNTLVSGGLKKEVAAAKVDLFSNLTDEQFTALANELIEANKAKCDDKMAEDEEEDDVDANEKVADTSVVENATVTETTTVTPPVVTSVEAKEATITALANFLETNYLKTKKK